MSLTPPPQKKKIDDLYNNNACKVSCPMSRSILDFHKHIYYKGNTLWLVSIQIPSIIQ